MKAQVTILLCLLIALAGCGNESLWVFGDNDALGIRVGTEIAENVEVGASSMWWPESDNDTQLYGAYAFLHQPGETVSTYFGVQTPMNNTYYDQVAPVVGVILEESENMKIFTEYQYKNWDAKEAQEEDKIVVGVLFTW